MCHELGRLSGVVLRRVGLCTPPASPRRWAREVVRRKGGVSCAYVVGAVNVALDGVGVSGDKACTLELWPWAGSCCFDLDVRGCGFAGTAVCVELLDVDELDGVGDDGREGVGVVMAEEESVYELPLDDRVMTGAEEGGGLGVVGADGAAGTGVGGSLTNEARCWPCRDASEVASRLRPILQQTVELLAHNYVPLCSAQAAQFHIR
jgi:hypothetical protein